MQIIEEAQDILPQVQEILPKMSRNEKAQLMQLLISDLTDYFPGIEKTPGVCGGDACIAGTRIMVWLLVRQWQLGMTEEQQLEYYPSLRLHDLRNAKNYYLTHQDEIERQIRENEEDYEDEE